MSSLTIRPATRDDLSSILPIYDSARRFMASRGNPTQWPSTYPGRQMLCEDIDKGQLYVICNPHICGVFVFALGNDPTYAQITGGAWLNNAPYGTIHRIASNGTTKGIFSAALAFCRGICPNIRIDTHRDNLPMQAAINRAGFTYCGIITAADGTPRLAYQASF